MVHKTSTKIFPDMLFSKNDSPEQYLKKTTTFPEKSNDKAFKEIKKHLLDHCSNSAGKPGCFNFNFYSLKIHFKQNYQKN